MLNQEFVGLDVEATGMDPGVDHIIEIGAVKFEGHRIIDRFSSLVRPERNLSLSIANLTGISNADVADAPSIHNVLPRLRTFVGTAPIVGQSVQFDLEMLSSVGLRFTNRSIDTYEFATIVLPDLPSYDLGTIAGNLQVDVDGKHRAFEDAETSMRVFNALVDRIDQYDDLTLERMVELTRTAGSSVAFIFRLLQANRRAEIESLGGSTIGAQLMSKLAGTSSPGPEAAFLVPRDRPARLEPSASLDDGLDVDAILASDGPFSKSLENYEVRTQQAEMMRAVAEAIDTADHLIVEAGTGTGKSLGYLAPAAVHSMRHGEPVVISTATIALQDQLIEKDVPALRAAAAQANDFEGRAGFGQIADLRATVLKGRSNYLCLRRWFIANRESPSDPMEAELHAKITAWLNSTETGDRAELRLTPDQHRHWFSLSEEEGSCIPGQCVFHRNNQCFLFRARANAEASHIIVVNHALLLSDLLRGGSVLPPYRHLIVDEAHHLEDEATAQAGFNVSSGGLRNTLTRISISTASDEGESLLARGFRTLAQQSPPGSDTMRTLQDAIAGSSESARSAIRIQDAIDRLLEDVLDRYSEGQGGAEPRARITTGVRSDPTWTEIEIEWDQLSGEVGAIADAVRKLKGAVAESAGDESGNQGLLADLEQADLELAMLRSRGIEIVSGVDQDLICWITRNRFSDDISLNAVPLSVAEILQSELYGRLESLTLTSATLTTEGSFSFIRDRLGLPDANALQVSSPFDYEESTLVAVTDDVPEPNQQGHQKMLQRSLIEVCTASRGRAMVLFTSHSALQNSYYAIRPALEREGIQVLGQRIDGSPRQLIERLGDVSETVLLGTNSFWEGVDIVGDRLSLLVITRLPFSVPTDPVFAARSELFENPFIQYAVPQAILRFKQGFGRLIRSANDRGVVAILDRRIISRRYGRAFLNSLPPSNVIEAGHVPIARATAEWLER